MVDPRTDEADERVIAAVQPLSDQLRRRERRDTLVRLFATVALLLLLLNAWDARASRHKIEGCTTAGHACYDEGVHRTDEAVKGIVDADHDGKPDVQELRDDLARAGLTTTSLPSPTSTTSTTEPCDRTEQTCP